MPIIALSGSELAVGQVEGHFSVPPSLAGRVEGCKSLAFNELCFQGHLCLLLLLTCPCAKEAKGGTT